MSEEPVAPAEKALRLTGKQKVFADAYLGKAYFNATAAARIAGYSDPHANGASILKNPKVAAYIEEQLKEHGITKDRVLSFLADVQAGPAAYLIPMSTRAEFDIDQMIEDGKGHLIKGTREKSAGEGERIFEVEFHDAFAATALLARVLKLDKGVEVNIALPSIREIVVNRPYPAETEDDEPAAPLDA